MQVCAKENTNHFAILMYNFCSVMRKSKNIQKSSTVGIEIASKDIKCIIIKYHVIYMQNRTNHLFINYLYCMCNN